MPQISRSSVRSILTGLAALLVLAGCTFPVRFATPAEVAQANARPSPLAAPAAPSGGGGGLSQLQSEFHQLIAQVTPSVVQIDTDTGLGSGVIVDTQGTIVTNAHVVDGSQKLTVTTSDGATHPATLVGSYPRDDLAVVSIQGVSGLKAARFGDSSAVQIGDVVVAVGSPLGLSESVSEGIVSGTGRAQSEGNGVTLTGLIQTTAAINPGNSGGALVDTRGQVIGIPTLGAANSQTGGSAAGIGFAIPSNQVTTIVQQIKGGGTVTHTGIAYLGVTTRTSTSGGATVQQVVAGGPADRAGVAAGWVITAIAGHQVPDAATISQILSGYKPGDRVSLSATLPDGSTKTVTITLGERPAVP